MLRSVLSRWALPLALLLMLLSAGLANDIAERQFAFLQGTYERHRAALTFADRLRQTSDDLTRMVRLFAITGEPRYREYFEEILAIRNGEMPRPVDYFTVPYWDIVLDSGERPGAAGAAVPIRTLASEAGLLPEPMGQIEAAEDASNVLAGIENEIMDVVAAQSAAGGGDYALEGDALAVMQRLHGPEYFAAKSQVMIPLVALGRQVAQDFQDTRAQSTGYIDALMQTAGPLYMLSLLLIVADFWLHRGQKWDRRRLFPLLAFLGLLLVMGGGAYNEARRAELSPFVSARLEAQEFADNLRQTSDDLTLMARLNAVTGEPQYREYFDEILAIRNGEMPRPQGYFDQPYWDIVLDTGERPAAGGEAVAIRTLAGDAGLLEGELAALARAEDASNALVTLENEVMDVIAAQRAANDGEHVLAGEALAAMQRLHGAEYHAAKAQVMGPLAELAHMVEVAHHERYDAFIAMARVVQQVTGLVWMVALLLLAATIWLRRGPGWQPGGGKDEVRPGNPEPRTDGTFRSALNDDRPLREGWSA